MNVNIIRYVSLFALSAAALSANAINLVSNPSFETGDFTNWTLVGDPNFTFVDTGFSSDGNFAAWLGEFNGVGSLTQTIATVPGASYTFSFDFAGDNDNPSFFSAAFGSNTVMSVTNPPFDVDYVSHSFTVVASSATTDVKFSFLDEPFFLNLDNVSVTANAVPEPASMAALGVGALCLLRRRKKA